ncbi:M23 family metallopeptidase [Metabacillus fastidiosus]|uniref:M23 family metallopeptidase n=1 Tax=Metabacillus fastidiosus TaxID=1458 RepID=UPI003D2BE165
MNYQITSKYLQQESFRKYPHMGIDLKMNIGEPLRAIESGVIFIRDYGNFNAGKTIIIKSFNGKEYIYGHLSEFKVRNGQLISKGELIGLSGNTGHSTGAHLHFGVKENGEFIDPSSHIEQIQNMNNPTFLSNFPIKTETISQSSIFDMLKETSNMYNDLLQNFKFQLIHLIDYSIYVQNFKYLLQFFS